jgi:cysteine desulfurase
MEPIYLDYNATTPIAPRVLEAMRPYLETHFGNPSCGHAFGAAAREAVDRARGQVAQLLGCAPQELIFTSGGSEANNLAIKGAVLGRGRPGDRIITSAVEHPAVTEVCRHLERQGFEVLTLEVDGDGLVDPAAVADALTPRTLLVSVMHANNEVGTLQPIREIAAIARRGGVRVHSDCAQSVGKVPVRVDELDLDLLSLAGHKLYAPKGVGALYVRGGVELETQIHGAGHERGLRAGTENVAGIVGLGAACELVSGELDQQTRRLQRRRDRLERGLRQRLAELRINGHPVRRLPNTCSVSFRGLEAGAILERLAGVAASAGAACHGGGVTISSVLTAMKVPLEYARGTVRFSVGRFTTTEQVDRAVELVVRAVRELREEA